MPYRICKTFHIESGHTLSKHRDNCRYPHGHSRRVELVLESDTLDAGDMVCDFAALTVALRDLLDSLDHAMYMNTKDPMYPVFKEAYGDRVIGFDGADPTTEVVAKRVFDQVTEHLSRYADRKDQPYPLSGRVRLVRARVWETSTSWAEYEA